MLPGSNIAARIRHCCLDPILLRVQYCVRGNYGETLLRPVDGNSAKASHTLVNLVVRPLQVQADDVM